jgi:glycosyltransferase involved in cell wall biosynthesis
VGPVVRSILHVAQPTTEGVARCVADLAAYQQRLGWRVSVASPPEGDLPRWVVETGARHLSWRAVRSPGLSVPRETLHLRRLIGADRPEIIHLHSAKAGLAGRLALRGRLPTIYQPHAWSFLAAQGLVRRGALRWERWAARWTDALVCVSRSEREGGITAGVQAPWQIVPNGVDLERFAPLDRSEARRRVGVPSHGPLVVCVGRLDRQKGQDVLLEAWASVSLRRPEATLALVGTGPEEAALRASAPRGVLFPGASTDVPGWLAAADLVVLPSRWEGMSLSMLEAMAAGRSLVMSDVPGAAEALSQGGGALVAPESPEDLFSAILQRLLDPELREEEGAAGRRVAQERFGLERSLAAMQVVYEEVLRRREVAEVEA